MQTFKEPTQPCPFCGGVKITSIPTYNFHSEQAGFRVGCEGCGASTKAYTRHNRAVAAWDRRPGHKNWDRNPPKPKPIYTWGELLQQDRINIDQKLKLLEIAGIEPQYYRVPEYMVLMNDWRPVEPWFKRVAQYENIEDLKRNVSYTSLKAYNLEAIWHQLQEKDQ